MRRARLCNAPIFPKERGRVSVGTKVVNTIDKRVAFVKSNDELQEVERAWGNH